MIVHLIIRISVLLIFSGLAIDSYFKWKKGGWLSEKWLTIASITLAVAEAWFLVWSNILNINGVWWLFAITSVIFGLGVMALAVAVYYQFKNQGKRKQHFHTIEVWKGINWKELSDAYGSAAGIPRLISQIPDESVDNSPSSEPWASLWSHLCHQGNVYTASYAAVLYFAQVVSNNQVSEKTLGMNYFLLPASIEMARAKGKGPEVPKEFAKEYYEAIERLGECALRYERAPDERLRRSAQAAHLVAIGGIEAAEKLIPE